MPHLPPLPERLVPHRLAHGRLYQIPSEGVEPLAVRLQQLPGLRPSGLPSPICLIKTSAHERIERLLLLHVILPSVILRIIDYLAPRILKLERHVHQLPQGVADLPVRPRLGEYQQMAAATSAENFPPDGPALQRHVVVVVYPLVRHRLRQPALEHPGVVEEPPELRDAQ